MLQHFEHATEKVESKAHTNTHTNDSRDYLLLVKLYYDLQMLKLSLCLYLFIAPAHFLIGSFPIPLTIYTFIKWILIFNLIIRFFRFVSFAWDLNAIAVIDHYSIWYSLFVLYEACIFSTNYFQMANWPWHPIALSLISITSIDLSISKKKCKW